MENKLNLENNSYFQTLPKVVQETIKQTSAEITSEEQLRKIAENMMKNNS